MRMRTLGFAVLAGTLVAGAAWAWGSTGHRLIGEEAMRALPDYVPEFMRSPAAAADVAEYAKEPDRWRGAGKVHDSDRDAAHFIDIEDDGKTFAGVGLDALPETRFDYDMAVVANGKQPWKAGYLPYAEVDAYQQIVKDMAYWRVENLLEARESDKVKKAWYRTDRLRREQLILRDIGVLAHYVGDATQPMHVSVHYNGWGDYPNPDGYTNERVHVPLEGAYVGKVVTAEAVRARIGTYTPCTEKPMVCFTARLKVASGQVVPLYQLQKDGGFAEGDVRGVDFMTGRIAKGAQDLRDTVLDAWRDSKSMGVGWPATTYDDFVANKVADPWVVIYGDD